MFPGRAARAATSTRPSLSSLPEGEMERDGVKIRGEKGSLSQAPSRRFISIPSRSLPKYRGSSPHARGAPPSSSPPPPPGGTDRGPLPPHLSLSWSSVPGSGCTTKWIDVMFCSPSLEGGGQGPGAQGGNGGGAGGRTGEGELGVSFRMSRSHSGAFAPHEGSEKGRAARGAGTAGKGSVSTPLSHEPPS